MATTITASPFTLKNSVVTISSVGAPASAVYEHQSSLDKVVFTPSSSTTTWTGLANNTVTDTSTATWTVDLEYAQDWSTANSLSQYLFSNEGTTKVFTFKPISGAAPTFTATVTLTPGAIGGDVNAFALATVSLGCTKPVLS